MKSVFTKEELARRNATIWTPIVLYIALFQFLAYFIGFYLVIRFLMTGEGYQAASIIVWIKILLMWAVTITGMIWEKVVVNHWFMAKQYFREDFGNLVAMITHNAYFVALWMGFSQREIMYVMLFAFITYIFNLVQWAIVGIRSWQQRRRQACVLIAEEKLD